jgi:hypothetical protein
MLGKRAGVEMKKWNWGIIGIILFLMTFWFGVFKCFAQDDKIMVQIIFTEDIPINSTTITYTDALYLTPENYVSFGDNKEVINRIKQARIAKFIDTIKNPPKPIEPTKEDFEKEQVSIDEQILSLQNRKVEIGERIKTIR